MDDGHNQPEGTPQPEDNPRRKRNRRRRRRGRNRRDDWPTTERAKWERIVELINRRGG